MINNHEVCSKGCYLYDINEDENLVACPKCGNERRGAGVKIQKFRRVTAKIGEMIICDETREKLMYRHNNYAPTSPAVTIDQDHKDKVYNDIFDGELYRKQCALKKFDNKLDIALKLDIDGFRSKTSSTHMIMIHVVVLNFDISEVSELKHKN